MAGLAELFKHYKDPNALENFKRWFGASKAVDELGNPIIAYHATGGDFDVFNTQGGTGKTFNTGAFLSSSPATASTYALGESPNIMPSYLSMQNPMIIDAGGTHWKGILPSAKVSLPEITVPDLEDEMLMAELEGRQPNMQATKKLKAKETKLGKLIKSYPDDTFSTDDLARWARGQGYEGLIVKNVIDRGPSGKYYTPEANLPGNVYVAFHPEQIKSAIGNTGEFSPNSPSILRSHPIANAIGLTGLGKLLSSGQDVDLRGSINDYLSEGYDPSGLEQLTGIAPPTKRGDIALQALGAMPGPVGTIATGAGLVDMAENADWKKIKKSISSLFK